MAGSLVSMSMVFGGFAGRTCSRWDARTERRARRKTRAHDRAAEVLAEYGWVTPYELSKFQGIHVGNARKYLALLAIEGRAHRHDDGEWFPGRDCQEEEAELDPINQEARLPKPAKVTGERAS